MAKRKKIRKQTIGQQNTTQKAKDWITCINPTNNREWTQVIRKVESSGFTSFTPCVEQQHSLIQIIDIKRELPIKQMGVETNQTGNRSRHH